MKEELIGRKLRFYHFLKNLMLSKCRNEPKNLNVNLRVSVVWILGHSSFEDNEHADELAKLGLALHDYLAKESTFHSDSLGAIFVQFCSLDANYRWSRLSNRATS